jgi:hypothetical protein
VHCQGQKENPALSSEPWEIQTVFRHRQRAETPLRIYACHLVTAPLTKH